MKNKILIRIFSVILILLVSNIPLIQPLQMIVLPNSTANFAYNGTTNDNIIANPLDSVSPMNNLQYTQINKTDTNSFTLPGNTASVDTYLYVNFSLPAGYNGINITSVHNASAVSAAGFALYNFGTNTFDSIKQWATGTAPTQVSYNVTTANYANYVSNNQIRVMIYDNSSATMIFRIDSLYLNVSWNVPTDTCTYPGSGDWSIAISDNCTLSTPTDIGANSLIVSGTQGSLKVATKITAQRIYFTPTNFDGDFMVQTAIGGSLSAEV